MITSNEITTVLKTILDPELGYNIVDLGLVYNITIPPQGLGTKDQGPIVILITLTSPGCPLAPYFIDTIKQAVAAAADCSTDQITVDITFDPPWSSEALSEEMKLNLGL